MDEVSDDLCVRCAKNTVAEDRMTCDPCMDEVYEHRPWADPRKSSSTPVMDEVKLLREAIARIVDPYIPQDLVCLGMEYELADEILAMLATRPTLVTGQLDQGVGE